jgi:hypothetical protein
VAGGLREGLDETLTVLSLGISDRLRHSLATTNAIESLLSRTRHVKRNVTRDRSPARTADKASSASSGHEDSAFLATNNSSPGYVDPYALLS